MEFHTSRDCFTEYFVDSVKSLENKTEIDNTISDTVTTLYHDKLITLFDNKYIDILNRDEWEYKYLDKNKDSAFNSKGGQKLKSVMCYNCGKL